MLKPYYLNHCECGNTTKCQICRSKWSRAKCLAQTDDERKEVRDYARLKYKYLDEERKEKYRKKNRNYYRNLPPDKKKERIESDRNRKLELKGQKAENLKQQQLKSSRKYHAKMRLV